MKTVEAKKDIIRNIKSSKLILAIAGLILLTLLYKIYVWVETESTDNAYVDADVSMISSQVSGNITEVLCGENQLVKTGDVIARVDDTTYKAQLQSATAKVKGGEYALTLIEQKIDLENNNFKKVQEVLDFAQVNLDLATKDYKRTLTLAKDNFSSQKLLDGSKAALEKAKFDFSQAKLSLDMSRQNLEILSTQRLSAMADLDALKQAEIVASEALKHTSIRSPIDGTTASSGLEKGNFVSPGMPLVYIVPKSLYIRANFKENQVVNFQISQEIEFEVDAVKGRRFHGKIRNISPATGSTFSLIPTDNATGNFTKIVQRIPVSIDFDHSQEGADMIRNGMSATVWVRI